MKRRILSPTIICIAVLLVACYPKGPESTADFNLVVTNHDVVLNFQSVNTYVIPDSVVKITGA